MENNKSYTIVDYKKVLYTFPNIKSKLKKKLEIKRDILINRLGVEKNRKKSDKHLMNFYQAEIDLITHIIESKEVKDDV